MLISNLFKNNKSIWLVPTFFIALFFVSHIVFRHYTAYIASLINVTPQMYQIESCVYLVLMAICEYWLCIRLITQGFAYLQKSSFLQSYPTLFIVLPFISSLFKALSFLIIFNLLTQNLELPIDVYYALNKISSVLIICVIGWLLFKLIDAGEQLLLHHFTAEISGVNVERKVFTQTLILKRVAYSIVSILTIGAILVLFENVRALGASVLTTAGVVGLILTFTAQRSLASIFSGLEIALTQPIKIGDSVVIDNEFGVIEEINFRNVVVKLWDWRRLVVPTNSFLDKTFQNWSRVQNTNLIGTVYLYVDFTLPVDEARGHLEHILEQSTLWDKNVGLLQVGDLQERVMQLKILASSHDPDSLSNLRAYIREELMRYIVKNHPYALPKTRFFTINDDMNLDIINDERKLVDAY